MPATLFVGESRPYPREAVEQGGVVGRSAVQELLVGTTLDVTPSIRPNELVTLDLHLKIDRFGGNQTIPNVGEVPVVSSKEAQAKVEVRDHDTVLLGGMVGASEGPQAAYVPFPKELPVPGVLSARPSARSAQEGVDGTAPADAPGKRQVGRAQLV